MGVVMDLKDGALSVSFRVENEAVRELLQNSLPQLKTALSAQGVSVEGFDVHSSGHQAGDESGTGPGSTAGRAADNAGNSDGTIEAASAHAGAAVSDGGSVDYWA